MTRQVLRTAARHSWRGLRLAALIFVVLLAVAFVTTVSVDLGPGLRARAEEAGSQFLDRPMTIGSLSIQLWRGHFVVEDMVIGGPDPESRPFLTARRIDVSMPWTTLFSQRVVFDTIEMSDWEMFVESFPGGVHTFPDFTGDESTDEDQGGGSNWTTTLQFVRAHRGEFRYEDHGTPWHVVARNLDVIVARPTSEYRGQATFIDGTVAIQDYVPMRADLTTSFRIVDGQIVLDRIDLDTDGASSELTGVVDPSRWPEQTYEIRSSIDYARMRDIFFADDDFTLTGNGDFEGTFHMFPGGRELTGRFGADALDVNQYRFDQLAGAVTWLPDRLDVTGATAGTYGGRTDFDYFITDIGKDDRPARARLNAVFDGVDLEAFSLGAGMTGLLLSGQASGRHLLEWPLGNWSQHAGAGSVEVVATPGVTVMTRSIPSRAATAPDPPRDQPFSDHLPLEPVVLAGTVDYSYGPDAIHIGPSRLATADTYLEFEGRSAYGAESNLPFHVTSADWQESDRLLAAVMTALGSSARPIPISGYGTFDGVALGDLSRPRVEGIFVGERLRAFDVVWGRVRGETVIENNYVDVARALIEQEGAMMTVDGQFSLGYPRADGGDEIDARLQISEWPMSDLRHAFRLDDYDVTGVLSGEYRVFGAYERPFGFGTMSISDGVAYGETFDVATATLRLEGDGARFDAISIEKAGGGGAGAAVVGWDGTYAFNFDAERMQVEGIDLASASHLPLSGVVDFSAVGSGTFDVPRYEVRGNIRDFFVGDEGLGEVFGSIAVTGDVLTLNFEAASPRLAVSGTGRVVLDEARDADLTFSVADTSIDPYLRVFMPEFPAFTSAVASGNVRVLGSLADIDQVLVEANIDTFDMRFFDYAIANDGPILVALDQHAVVIDTMRLVGDGTALAVTGEVDLHNQRIQVRAEGTANLGILQGFEPDLRGSGQVAVSATLEGELMNPLVDGTMSFENGRVRYFGLPHAVENLSGEARFDSRGLILDGVTGRLGGGDVALGGRIEIDGYLPSRLDVTLSGQGMRLRFPEGMRSLVDADLSVQGTVALPTLSGAVRVRSAVYTTPFDATGGLFDLAGEDTAGVVGREVSTIPLRYDVRIAVPSTLRVENDVVRMDASADLQLRGTYDRPLLVGRAEIDRGEVEFEGRRYTVRHGTIDFTNPTRIEPFFDIEAETRVRVPGETYRITVRATGTLDRLTPEVTSDPPLPEVEVLSLLFSDVVPGRDVEFRRFSTALTPEQQLLQERVARALTGTVSSEVGRVVEDAFGVDTFQLTPSLVDPNEQSSRLDPAARLTIGKRLNDRLFLTYARSLSSSTGRSAHSFGIRPD